MGGWVDGCIHRRRNRWVGGWVGRTAFKNMEAMTALIMVDWTISMRLKALSLSSTRTRSLRSPCSALRKVSSICATFLGDWTTAARSCGRQPSFFCQSLRRETVAEPSLSSMSSFRKG